MNRSIELTPSEISHLILLLNNNEREPRYYPPKEGWWTVHASLLDKLVIPQIKVAATALSEPATP